MSTSPFSPSWYRVAGLCPRLRSHLDIHRHHYRGERWYVLQDHASGKFQRLTPAAHMLVGLMDGKRTVQEIWETTRLHLQEEAPTQDEVIQLLSQLHAADALQVDTIPDTTELTRRYEKQRGLKLKQNLRSPLFMRFALFDPERLLVRFQHLARPFFGWFGLLIWLALVGPALFQVGVHWSALTENLADRVLAPQNLLVMWLIYPILKTLHEFGHAFAVKIRGGEVHEMGIMLLVFTPIPYVDASAASAFRKKSERIIVGAAGMLIEIFCAAIAVLVWANAEPGPVRAVAFNVIFIAGVSSLLFNGNPLLRYDAYYILSDLLEIPNLGPRGNRYVMYLIQRYLFGLSNVEPPVSTAGERAWFVGYTIAAVVYRLFIYASIVLFVASRFFFVGVLFACWALFNMLVMPLFKALKFIVASPRLQRRRFQAVLVSAAAACGLAALIAVVPVPLSTISEGVVWIPEASFVRAGTDGFVKEIVTPAKTRVLKGQPLVQCEDPFLPAEIQVLRAQLEGLRAIYDAQFTTDLVAAKITEEEIENVTAQLDDALQRAAEQTIRSGTDGVFILPHQADLPGRFVRRGDLVGYVLSPGAITARVVVNQTDIDLVRRRTREVAMRFPEAVDRCVSSRIFREVPAATDQLPSRTLSLEGGGEIAIDPRDASGTRTFQKIFLFDVALPADAPLYNIGGRVYVRFDHGSEPLVWRWYRSIRQLFLRRFNV
jgi:putative peptide zinc metalloprotease protein